VFPLLDASRLRFTLSATYVNNMKVGSQGNWVDYAGTNGWLYNSPISGGGPVPRWRATIAGGWENVNWITQVAVHYTDSYADVCYEDGFCGQEAAQVPSFSTIDLYGEYDGLKNWKFSASIINLLNSTPPWDWFAFATSGYEPFDQTLYDARGRVLQFRAQYRF
ncbi:MAG TPA: TonB-dependent receptor, partial [Burkholderiaceae bacterium]|nr:TonB-dependent receptor [Burkholderiaceae bacterium]